MIRVEAMLARFRRRAGGEGGYSLPELSVAIIVGSVILGGLFTLLQFSVRSNARTTGRVAADQAGRPAMQRIVDELHSACIYPGLAPVQAGSTDNTLSFISSTGSDANPTPVLHKIVFDSTTGSLIDYSYPYASGTAPNWTFSATPSPSAGYKMLERAYKVGSTPVFSYYKYVSGAISGTALPATVASPLTTDNAKLAVQVNVSFETAISANAQAVDSSNAVTLAESVLLRFSPSNEDTNKAGLPCT